MAARGEKAVVRTAGARALSPLPLPVPIKLGFAIEIHKSQLYRSPPESSSYSSFAMARFSHEGVPRRIFHANEVLCA